MENRGPQDRGFADRWRRPLAKYFLKLGDREVEAVVEEDEHGLRINLGDGWRTIDLRRLGTTPRFALTLGNRAVGILATGSRDSIDVLVNGVTYSVGTRKPQKGRAKPEEDEDTGRFDEGLWTLRSPQTGSVVDLRVAVGDKVEQGTTLMVLEAMKMQNELRSRVTGSVAAIKVERGQRVETGAALIEIAAPSDAPP